MGQGDATSSASWTSASSVARCLLLLALAACCVVNIDGVDGRGPMGHQQSSRSAAKVHNSAAGADHPSSSTTRLTAGSKVVDNETDLSGSTDVGRSSSSSSSFRVRKRSKWHSSSSYNINKEGSFLKRIVTEVIAERDAQIAAALFEVAKNQPHLQMMVQTLGELSQSNQRLELSSTRLDETQRRLDSRMGVISEKMTLLETRLSQTERRIEREMTHVHGKLDDFFRGISNNVPDKSMDSLMRAVKQLQNQVNSLEELLLERTGGGPSNHQNHHKLRSKSRQATKSVQSSASSSSPASSAAAATSTEIQKLGNSLSQALAAAHNDLVRVVRESETNLDHQLSMLATDNGVFSCAISRLMERTSKLTASGSASVEEANSIQTAEAITLESLATNGTRCVLKCP